MILYLLVSGDGSDGDEWILHGIYSTREKAEAAQRDYQQTRRRPDGSEFFLPADIEEWPLDPTAVRLP